VSSLDVAHDGQVLHYLRATSLEVGLLLNLAPERSSDGSYLRMIRRKSVFFRVSPRSMR
jgi:hypothetical protein